MLNQLKKLRFDLFVNVNLPGHRQPKRMKNV
jgi:hypothetical protein